MIYKEKLNSNNILKDSKVDLKPGTVSQAWSDLFVSSYVEKQKHPWYQQEKII